MQHRVSLFRAGAVLVGIAITLTSSLWYASLDIIHISLPVSGEDAFLLTFLSAGVGIVAGAALMMKDE